MTLSTQFVTMITMIGMGSLFGACLDTYNRFLHRSARKRWIVFIHDILFWLLQGLVIFYVLYLINHGEIRFYIFIALLCGFAAYQSLFKKFYLKLLEIAIAIVIAVYKIVVKSIELLIFRPLKSLVLFLISIILLLARGVFSLAKLGLSILLFITKVFWKPVKLLFLFVWKLLPKNVKKIVEKLYNNLKGFCVRIKNYIETVRNRWKKTK
ncbi:spore cortex biosynthesis protein YabQ [Bacillus canaveralius]|uniref:Spore cortex biosynthesis protein YabQ n=1 Tax=Bacillus canaveralius TaxID=1403243 RepID=A0A2N5GHH4_9BACI|nr:MULTISPECIES: spore cortex biosynthesis protein YabQ [Bacillus]PLR80246.1 spore cortex biosynthesis protein YabQ [Bacillus canaveralius]PLR83219.1 spore cortex biosynthesis protein YabQ [Bacillus sp. V33-4]PLS00471.1 spore cortex biosynthesis protein YabQ [Bacillus canaveralius]RSK56874.1 spore cortex biosynthesis protein YabQ [Bacillus canaveralius]